MDTNIIIIISSIVLSVGLAIGILIAYFNKKFKSENPDEQSQKLMLELLNNLRSEMQQGNLQNRKEIQERLDAINDQVMNGISQSSKTLQNQFKQSSQIIQEVTSRLTKLDDTNKQILDFSSQLQSLENILKNPKQRGILGEYYLETLLSQVLPPGQYKMQYKFKDSQIVDAAVFIDDKIVPIDAKFSLEKYNELMEEKVKSKRELIERQFKIDIKNRIDETAKYIRPHEGTTDFAIMFIPAEGIFYNLLIYKVGTVDLNTHDLVEYAFKKRVIITSPTSFFAYLQTILQGLKALKVEESVKEILKNVQKLSKHLNAYESNFKKVGNHLGTTVNMYNQSYKELEKIDKDVYKITDGKSGGKTEILEISKPEKEE